MIIHWIQYFNFEVTLGTRSGRISLPSTVPVELQHALYRSHRDPAGPKSSHELSDFVDCSELSFIKDMTLLWNCCTF